VAASARRSGPEKQFVNSGGNCRASRHGAGRHPGSGQQAQAPANEPSNALLSLPTQGREAERDNSGTFVFKTEVQEVTLHATVVDDHQRLVTTLDRTSFQVFEDGLPQRITSFRREDIPVALGIVIDNSGSMREKRSKVNAAALNLVRASNPQDQVFIVNFTMNTILIRIIRAM